MSNPANGSGEPSGAGFVVNMGRAFGGALLFNLPMLMTMNMWELGYYMNRFRLVGFILVLIPLLARLSFQAGFEENFSWSESLRDALVALAVGYVSSAAVLWIFGVLRFGMSLDDLAGKVAIQAPPAGIGAVLARSQFGQRKARNPERRRGRKYLAELFLMAVGALFFAFNIAPTQEVEIISYRASVWQIIVLLVFSVAMMHALVYAVQFRGQADIPKDTPQWNVFLRFTVTGYALALLVSLGTLWAFGRTDGVALLVLIEITVVLGFPAALGAAAARLIL